MTRAIEAVVLTGGRSSRMGADKASLEVDGVSLSERTAVALSEAGYEVTVLGREPVQGFSFLRDEEEFAGPLAALGRFTPRAEFVFVASCDMPRFDARMVPFLASQIAGKQAAVPQLEGRFQPTCALYSASAWPLIGSILASGKQSLMALLDLLEFAPISQSDIREAGLDPRSFRGANSPVEFKDILLEP